MMPARPKKTQGHGVLSGCKWGFVQWGFVLWGFVSVGFCPVGFCPYTVKNRASFCIDVGKAITAGLGKLSFLVLSLLTTNSEIIQNAGSKPCDIAAGIQAAR